MLAFKFTIDPINKVWYINPQDVIIMEIMRGIFDATRILYGHRVLRLTTKYYKTIRFVYKKILTEAGLKKGDNRIISGSILSQIPADGYLGFMIPKLL
jgi:Na+-transporting NADH:ubiquinone oxidoreductase subunit A